MCDWQRAGAADKNCRRVLLTAVTLEINLTAHIVHYMNIDTIFYYGINFGLIELFC